MDNNFGINTNPDNAFIYDFVLLLCCFGHNIRYKQGQGEGIVSM